MDKSLVELLYNDGYKYENTCQYNGYQVKEGYRKIVKLDNIETVISVDLLNKKIHVYKYDLANGNKSKVSIPIKSYFDDPDLIVDLANSFIQ